MKVMNNIQHITSERLAGLNLIGLYVILFVLALPSTAQEVITWKSNAAVSDWQSPEGWVNQRLPSERDRIVVTGQASNGPTINRNRRCVAMQTSRSSAFYTVPGAYLEVVPAGSESGTSQRIETETSSIEVDQEHKLSCYPNPFNDRLTLAVQADRNAALSVRLIDNSGRTVIITPQQRADAGGLQHIVFDTGTLAPGIYHCVVQQESHTQTLKLVKLD